MIKKISVIIIFIIFSSFTYAAQKNSPQNLNTLDIQSIALQDALRLLAKSFHQNIVISPQITGFTALHLKNTSAQEAFDLLLVSHHLIKRKLGKTWYIAPKSEMLQLHQDESKLQTLLEESAPLTTRFWQIKFAKAEDVAQVLQENNNSLLTKRGHVRVDKRTNILCIQEIAARLNEIDQLIKKLDVPVRQVLIEARLASVDNDFERELGVNFAVHTPSTRTEDQSVESSLKRYSLAIAKLPDGSQLDVQLAALENSGHGELISSPSLFTANQQTASIESGEEIPYQEVSRSGGTAVTFKKAVLSLKVTPQIMPENSVLLHLQVNQDRPSHRMVLGVPAINTRQISTNVWVANGQTIVLGGIYEANQEQAEQRLPFLGKIPLVGWLFKQENIKKNKRELLIFVTPKIIPQLGLI